MATGYEVNMMDGLRVWTKCSSACGHQARAQFESDRLAKTHGYRARRERKRPPAYGLLDCIEQRIAV